jgi:hypothetical protein
MSAAVWEHVSQLVSLTQLVPFCWRSDITPPQWARLANFKQLHIIHIESHPDDDHDYSLAPLRTHFLEPLLQCVQLEQVSFAGSTLALSAAQLDGIARLPQLDTLHLQLVEVESIAPIVHAARLDCLYLLFCRGPPAVVDFRSSLPPLPALTELRLEDRCRITAAQAAPLNAEMLARMPALSLANLAQNLLAPAAAPPAASLDQSAAEPVVLIPEGIDDDDDEEEWEGADGDDDEAIDVQPVFGPEWQP